MFQTTLSKLLDLIGCQADKRENILKQIFFSEIIRRMKQLLSIHTIISSNEKQ